MWKSKKFFLCLNLKTGGILVAIYCTIMDILYIVALVSLYQYVKVTKHVKNMLFLDKVKAMGISISINFVMYHLVASILLSIGISKVREKFKGNVKLFEI